MPAQRSERAIDLLGQNYTRQFVGHRHRGERNQQIGPLTPLFRKPGVEERLNLQRDGTNAKPYQVKQVRAAILKAKLSLK